MHKYKVVCWKCSNVPTEQQNKILRVEIVNDVRVKFLNAERVVSVLEMNCGEKGLF